jgi:Acyl-CoA synthetases (AMP-forming)/AMP-acid ligases II
VPPDVDIPEVTLKDWTERLHEDFPEHAAFHFLDITWTYRELLEKADLFARALHACGLRKGDVIAINLVNSPSSLSPSAVPSRQE